MVVKKAAVKKGEAKKTQSVMSLLKAAFAAGKEVGYEQALKQVKAAFPKSKFNKAQFAWYKSAIKRNKKAAK